MRRGARQQKAPKVDEPSTSKAKDDVKQAAEDEKAVPKKKTAKGMQYDIDRVEETLNFARINSLIEPDMEQMIRNRIRDKNGPNPPKQAFPMQDCRIAATLKRLTKKKNDMKRFGGRRNGNQ